MTRLDADLIRRSLDGANCSGLTDLEIFPEIESTNSYLMRQPGPRPGQFRVAVTDNQTAGRGRHGKSWLSPPGSGLCLSMSYTFTENPGNIPALTLAIGLGIIGNLGKLGITGVQLKWPNDLIAGDGKLGGILTEAQMRANEALTIVTGIGVNIDLGDGLDLGPETDGALGVVDLRTHAGDVPSTELLAAHLVLGLQQTFVTYEETGFIAFAGAWPEYDWLFGRELVIDTPERQVSGVGAGIADDGSLLVETREAGTQRITSGSVATARAQEDRS